MTDPRRTILRDREVRNLLTQFAERCTDHLVGPDAPPRYFRYVDEVIVEAVEDAVADVPVDALSDWLMAGDVDEAADRERDEAVGL